MNDIATMLANAKAQGYAEGWSDAIKEILIAIDSFNKDIQWSNELQAIRNFVEKLKEQK